MAESTETESAGQRSSRLRQEMWMAWQDAVKAMGQKPGLWNGSLTRLDRDTEALERLVRKGLAPEELLEPLAERMRNAVSDLKVIAGLARAWDPEARPRLEVA